MSRDLLQREWCKRASSACDTRQVARSLLGGRCDLEQVLMQVGCEYDRCWPILSGTLKE